MYTYVQKWLLIATLQIIQIQPCEYIIVVPVYGICGTQSCMVTGAATQTEVTITNYQIIRLVDYLYACIFQPTDPTTECCLSIPLIIGCPIISGMLLNESQVRLYTACKILHNCKCFHLALFL